jgi:GntR family transcriptional regulator
MQQPARVPDPATAAVEPLRRSPEEGSSPLWAQLKARVLEMISTRNLAAHDQLPSEAELCRAFGVSRTVVREALNQLVMERRVYKMQGKGSFVAEPTMHQDFIGTTISFTTDFVGTSQIVSRRVLLHDLRTATPEEARKLNLAEDDLRLVTLDRILCVDEEPRTRVTALIRANAAPGFETFSMENRSLYETLRRRYGIILIRAERWIEALNADAENAGLLDVDPGSPLLGIESISYDQTGVAVELYTALHRTDRARLHFIVK